MKLRLGLIGLSQDWRSRHLPALRMLSERFEVVGVYNEVASLADNAAKEFDARRFDGFREMLSEDAIDAVMVLENGWYGTAPILAACEYGKAIYCGAEIEIAPEQAASLRNAVDRSGVAFMAEFPRRLAPASLRLKELIATRLGKPEILFCHHRLTAAGGKGSRSNQSSKQRMERVLVELIDWCAFIAGNSVRSVQATQHRGEQDAEPDYLALSLDLSAEGASCGSTIAQISCGTYIPHAWHEAANFRPPAALQVCCQNGLAFLDLPNSLIWFDEAGRHQESLESELSVGQQLLSQFHRAVTSLVRKTADLEDVFRGLNALQAGKESIRRGCGLKISD
ncbi:MAG: Gfo/Idh/MocA family oxidoreductase [bacterium]|nr:Gfo/Idh/MocA family oxidoreductase [bacterium]